jgi:hypothetical protein
MVIAHMLASLWRSTLVTPSRTAHASTVSVPGASAGTAASTRTSMPALVPQGFDVDVG